MYQDSRDFPPQTSLNSAFGHGFGRNAGQDRIETDNLRYKVAVSRCRNQASTDPAGRKISQEAAPFVKLEKCSRKLCAPGASTAPDRHLDARSPIARGGYRRMHLDRKVDRAEREQATEAG